MYQWSGSTAQLWRIEQRVANTALNGSLNIDTSVGKSVPGKECKMSTVTRAARMISQFTRKSKCKRLNSSQWMFPQTSAWRPGIFFYFSKHATAFSRVKGAKRKGKLLHRFSFITTQKSLLQRKRPSTSRKQETETVSLGLLFADDDRNGQLDKLHVDTKVASNRYNDYK